MGAWPSHNSAWNKWLEGLEETTEAGYPHPFFFPDNYGDFYSGLGEDPTTLAELRMMALSWSIRSKHDWNTKVKDMSMLERWRQEALEQQESMPIDRKLALDMHACNDSIFCSSRSIPDDVLTKLRSEAAQLEKDQKNWHPDSNEQISDFVDPSLYCIVYGHMGIPAPDQMLFHSTKLAWLPSDFSVAEDGAVRLASPYINNIHPSRTGLISTIESVLGSFVPMWERVLASIRHIRKDRDHSDNKGYTPSHRINDGPDGVINCLWAMHEDDEAPIDDEIAEDGYAGFPGEDLGERRLAWMRMLPETRLYLPEAYPEYTGALERKFKTISLRGKMLQVIIKLTNIHLTPDKPEYPGESWKVEGMMNERIVSTGIYYYDSENVTDSEVSFRVSVCTPGFHNWEDDFCTQILYGLEGGKELIQERGSITTHQGMALAFPNIYQHRVSPFALVDRSKPGHRKMLALFLVDPEVRVPSATEVPAQQEAWCSEAVQGSLAARLPTELRKMVVERVEGMVTLEEANRYRAELIEERGAFMEEYNVQVMQQKLDMTF
ncbi:hypothetical protein EWM64_g3749 [Hericium alpestre]|uniref:Uncharacterized protein n=1 Tax=Hericium alpestre TaxID=135208 RepID=A0A4Y9ZZG8_9AGAM|nr:hypothetical protein EWM64_g3749 [Hericium alpestre]